jgi:hypothetical protein
LEEDSKKKKKTPAVGVKESSSPVKASVGSGAAAAPTPVAAAAIGGGASKYEDNLDMTDLDLLDIGDDEDFEDLGVGQFSHLPSPSLSHSPFASSLSFLSVECLR